VLLVIFGQNIALAIVLEAYDAAKERYGLPRMSFIMLIPLRILFFVWLWCARRQQPVLLLLLLLHAEWEGRGAIAVADLLPPLTPPHKPLTRQLEVSVVLGRAVGPAVPAQRRRC
jgi:hypothetical protein